MAQFSDVIPGARTMMMGLLLYFGLLGASIGGAIHLIDHAQADAGEFYSASFWRDVLHSNSQSDEFQWQITQSAIAALKSGPHPKEADEFIAMAERQVERWRQPDTRLAQWRVAQVKYMNAKLSDEDVAYIKFNAVNDVVASIDDRVPVLLNLIEISSGIGEAERLELVQTALDLVQAHPDIEPELAAEVYFRFGLTKREVGRYDLARKWFEEGLWYELRSEYPTYAEDNYRALLDFYFDQEEYHLALNMIDARLQVLKEYFARDMLDMANYETLALSNVQQQRAWFLLLQRSPDAGDEFRDLLSSHVTWQNKNREAEYDRYYIELILDNIYSHRLLHNGDHLLALELLRKEQPEHIHRFVKSCKCERPQGFDQYRHERYLELLRALGLAQPF